MPRILVFPLTLGQHNPAAFLDYGTKDGTENVKRLLSRYLKLMMDLQTKY